MIDFKWSTPYKNEGKWRREYIIPPEMLSGFFGFWKKNKFSLLSQGFSVSKNKFGKWIFYETKPDIKSFKKFNCEDASSTPTPESQVIFSLPEYKLKNTDGLRPWQIDAAGRLVSAINYWGGAADGSDLGTGKTFSAIGTVRELSVPFVIVCPKAVINQWRKVIDNHFNLSSNCKGIINYELLIRGRKDSDIASFVLKRELKRHKFIWKIPKNSIIIWDESHKLKNFKTKSSKCCIEAFKQGFKQIFLSATMAQSPLDLRTIGTCLKMFKTSKEYYDWTDKHGVYKDTWGPRFSGDVEVLKKLNKYLFEERGVRKCRDEIPNFPECEVIIQAYDIDEAKVTEINKNFKEMSAELKRLNSLLKNEESQLVIRLRYRQRIELLKVDLFVDLANEALDAGMSVILFVNYTETINTLSERLNSSCIYSGQVSSSEKQKNIDNFQSNKEKIFIVQVKSGGTGLNLGDTDGNHPRCSIISPDDSARDIRQACGRGWRENSKSKSIVKIPFANGTIEASVVDNMNTKTNNIDIINDGMLKII